MASYSQIRDQRIAEIQEDIAALRAANDPTNPVSVKIRGREIEHKDIDSAIESLDRQLDRWASKLKSSNTMRLAVLGRNTR